MSGKPMQQTARSRFEDRGYLEPVAIFTPRECGVILGRLQQAATRPPMDWQKGRAATSPEYAAIAADDRILDLVTAVIGEDVILWGVSLVVRKPNQVHPWHTDIESSCPTGKTVSVWIGLANTSALSSLIIVPGSHRFGVTFQQVLQEERREHAPASDEEVASWAKSRDAESGVISLNMSDGEAVAFDGRLWHASHNRSQSQTRYALLLQYASPATAIRIPNFNQLRWPFELYPSPKPACILVSGHAMEGPNRIVPAPLAANGENLPSLSSRVHALHLPLGRDPERGFTPHPLFRGSTPAIRKMGCHVSVLDPGRQPHSPHDHVEEEVLIVLDGEADLMFADRDAPGAISAHRAQAGTFAYYPAGFTHTIRNTSDAPVTYLMFKWHTDRDIEKGSLRHCLMSVGHARSSNDAPASSMHQTRLLDTETEYLRHLRAHVTVLQPGAGYAPHIDAYDVGIIVLEGTVETLGERVGQHGLVFYAAGEPHGMTNVGTVPAVYVVFEFHGRHRDTDEPYDPRLSRRLLNVLRDPDRLKAAIRRRLRG
jgi:uncharacterized cupin superfamily protein